MVFLKGALGMGFACFRCDTVTARRGRRAVGDARTLVALAADLECGARGLAQVGLARARRDLDLVVARLEGDAQLRVLQAHAVQAAALGGAEALREQRP